MACSAPSWISFTATTDEASSSTHEVFYGPFYSQSQSRTCADGGQCSKWKTSSIDLSDCESIDSDDLTTLCNRLNTWRSLAIICLILVIIGGGFVFAGSCCCQATTCSCCGNSMNCIANMSFWTEVILSVVVWSFAISSLNLIGTGDSVVEMGYEWAFWVFMIYLGPL